LSSHRPCGAAGAPRARVCYDRPDVDTPPPVDAPLSQKPYTTRQVYGTLAAIAFGIVLMMASCCGAWLLYVQVRSDR